jgi:LysM repeat protein
MKFRTLSVKRRPVTHGMFRRLSAVTRYRKQRVAAPAFIAEMDSDEGNSKISRALIIIFLIHIVAIGLIFVHQKFLDSRMAKRQVSAKVVAAEVATTLPVLSKRPDLPRLATGEKPYIVRAGDNYARIATAEGVDESKLRLVNKHVDIGPGSILKIPPKRAVAMAASEVAAIHESSRADLEQGLVAAEPVNVSAAPKARPVRSGGVKPASDSAASTVAGGTGKWYVVQSGDSVWKIANRHKVSQDNLMRANGMSDARKLQAGMKLKIPQS